MMFVKCESFDLNGMMASNANCSEGLLFKVIESSAIPEPQHAEFKGVPKAAKVLAGKLAARITSALVFELT